ncbi:MAG: hypothetical protein HC902_01155 [Calothrix sp. SM1_5_4]|nr:hypothetical protein [Calothrix sp. SM1_5_4]
MIALLALAPFFAALFLCLAAGHAVLKKKSLAQSICVAQASRLQSELKESLIRLLRLNPRAAVLRRQRAAADRSLRSALLSGNPYAIATAKAVQSAVILAQTTFRASQLKILKEADLTRTRFRRETVSRLRRVEAGPLSTPHLLHPLFGRAGRARALTLSGLRSSIRVHASAAAKIPLLGQSRPARRLTRRLPAGVPRQSTECSVSLEEKEGKWDLRVLAASASWR